MTKAVYPGSFDPPTKGHLDVIKRGAEIFDELLVAVGVNPGKDALFTVDERLEMLREETADLANVTLGSFEGLVVDYVKGTDASVILRGIRSLRDLEHEFQMALTNRVISGGLETVFVMASQEYAYLDAHLVKEIVTLGGDVSAFLTPRVADMLKKKLEESG
jgi:pantetheine-phosphate adenylyltransferase